ncbi:protein Abitram-like [Oppia nitens]|uniref:protein Abitram-like n=1 Tax=Oppia nitens TaxID=1686743 RepID=UPI0023D9D01E|nr:protein Abitram-like [Oppia nitens]
MVSVANSTPSSALMHCLIVIETNSAVNNTREMLDSLLSVDRIVSPYESVCERYFQHKYYINEDNDGCDQLVLFHSNRVCLITLSPNHCILKQDKRMKNIDFNISDAVNRLDNKVSGKWKKGGQRVSPESILCRIECENNETFDIKCCLNGTIVEINNNLLKDMDLIKQKTFSDGFIAIILPFRGKHQSEKDSLLSPQQYRELLDNKL